MFILIHCGGLPFTGDSIYSQSLGGSETAAYYVAKGLAAKGHIVELWGNIPYEQENVWDGVRYCHIGQQTAAAPLGDRFEFYAQHTPHDVLIVQRAPQAFVKDYAAKIKILWCHDLAVVRNRAAFMSSLANCDAVFTVSEFHKQQIADVYGLKAEARDKIYPVTNGVDLALYNEAREKVANTEVSKDTFNRFKMIFQSRPERGLNHLVKPGGIMERLLTERPDAHLFVCGYQHDVPGLNPLYDMCNARIEELPNCTNLGNLSKPELAVAQANADLWIYPTEFEEVSCITAMEMMAAFTPGITSKHGALPETCAKRGITMFPLVNGEVNEDRFVRVVKDWTDKDTEKARSYLKSGALHFDWTQSVQRFEDAITVVWYARRTDPLAVANHLMRHSDIVALQYWLDCPDLAGNNEEGKHLANAPLLRAIRESMSTCFGMRQHNDDNDAYEVNPWPFDEDKQAAHYENYYQEYAAREGWLDDTTLLDTNPRVEEFAKKLEELEDGQLILDYGCFNGAFSITLARRFPQHRFIGVDCSAAVIDHAVTWAADLELDNVGFHTVESFEQQESLKNSFSVLIAGEILEHVWNYRDWFETRIAPWLDADVAGGPLCYITTPYGPWEWASFDKYDPYRFHLWHFEREDLATIFAEQDDLDILFVPQGRSERGELLGCYLSFFNYTGEPLNDLSMYEKINRVIPTDTLALNMIVKDGEESLLKTLRSVRWIVDAIYIGVDPNTTDNTNEVIRRFEEEVPSLPVLLFDNESPLDVGFDAARNNVLSRTFEQWVLMLDADEELINGNLLSHYLRNGPYHGFALAQHHFAVEPLGVLDTDYPCRLFVNDGRIKYEGVVHEHPERGNNEGAGSVIQLPYIQIAHNSYTTENARRKKFERNIRLMARDREENPDRILGAFLWIRDLALMCRFDLEHTQGGITPLMRERAEEGIRLWEKMVSLKHPMIPRLISDGLQFYTTLSQVIGGGFDFAISLAGSKLNGGPNLERAPVHTAHFLNRKHLETVLDILVSEETKDYDSRYF